MTKQFKKTRWLLFAVAACLALCLVPCASADEIPFPKTTEFVNDYASVLSQEDIRTLTGICQNLQTTLGYQMVIVTEPTLNGEDINHAGTRYMNELGVGRKGADTGVAIMLAMQERQVFISVGSGTKSVLTDAAAGRIYRDTMRPLLSEGKTGEAMKAGAQAVDGIIRAGGEGQGMPLSDGSSGDRGRPFPVGLLIFGAGGIGLIAVLATRAAFKCPRCGHWMTVNNQVVDPPGFLSNGYGIRTRTCSSCGYTDQNRYTIYRNSGGGFYGGGGGWSSGGSSGGWSGGGGGGGFSGGGGSCDGGGAGGGW